MSGWKSTVQRQFNEKAGSYDQYADVQKVMASRLMRRLDEAVPAPRDILEIGCGTGACTERVLTRFPQASVSALDIAPGMVEAAKRRLAARGEQCRWIVADVEEWAAAQSAQTCDLIVSNACFQWLAQPEVTLAHLYRLLRPGGCLLFSTFGPQTFWELHDSFHEAYARLGRPPARHGLTFRSEAQWKDMLLRAGFRDNHTESGLKTYVFPSVRQFLHTVKEIGASATQATGTRGLGQRRLMMEMLQQYETRHRIRSGIPATYEIILAVGLRKS